MPERPAAERTEQPTSRRLEKARQKGNLPQSQELTSVVSLLVLVVAVALMAPSLMRWAVLQVKNGMSCENGVFADTSSFLDFTGAKIIDLILVICPLLAALLVGSVMAAIAVSGLSFSTQAVRLKFNQLNPIEGFSRLVNARSMVRLLASVLKLLFVSFIVWYYLQSRLNTLAALRWAWSEQMLDVIARTAFGLLIRICLALLIVAVADAFYQKWKYIQELKMTRQEVKQERKETEGSPEVKGRIRRLQIEIATRRIREEVPRASVVLVNPTHVAVALRYDAKTMDAPVMVAKGADHMAEKIREIAIAYGVPIIRRPELARTIYATVKPGNPIPEKLYVAVAEVLAMIYRLRHKK
ncbi:MAG: flagellar biosynthesis protein FlhB [Phycisphaerales bacterium]|nr:MAG: flagellar biosynthesis protein FlhB [Phycisphaerales bacterium]